MLPPDKNQAYTPLSTISKKIGGDSINERFVCFSTHWPRTRGLLHRSPYSAVEIGFDPEKISRKLIFSPIKL